MSIFQQWTANNTVALVLCGCETWSLRLRKEHTLAVLEVG
jgi:hypothetical protein